ncbi:hypothetical protein RSAG8_11526, partial [Rhizoctonia solani AG-8 WAC10335]
MGEKVDTIEWARKEVVESDQLLNARHRKLADGRANIGVDMNEYYPPLNSTIILFPQQIGPHIATQILVHNQPYRMAERYIEAAPADVIWGSMGINRYEARVRKEISYAATAALNIFWAIPVSFVGVISNVAQFCVKNTWVQWLCNLPDVAIGIPRFTGVDLSPMPRYFIFQLVHSFHILTASSRAMAGLPTGLPQLASNPTSILTILAERLPEVATYFLTYAILQGLARSAAAQIVPLVLYYVKLYIFRSMPRSIYNIRYSLRKVAWGTLFPLMAPITGVGLAYSIISPIVNGLVCVGFFLFYPVWKYLFLRQFGSNRSWRYRRIVLSQGHAAHLCRWYIGQIYLYVLFFLSRNNRVMLRLLRKVH